ncbi:hypothetical protein [Ktedonospora formicarum]|uniref:Uncharacterized protein n=1 Tax=Ktedonospora formicarum TaxID=2778364 RepID=A0A8J3MQ12_9CHLR|nr:hypothetical protein [Ktedonospora formicarum]GHO42311.1 hypothetical protein KSX_04740 [Ktedonospora formicarum]
MTVVQLAFGPLTVLPPRFEKRYRLSPLAVRLLQLRDLARRDPERPAHEVLDPDLLAVVAAQTGQSPTQMTM